MTCLTNPYSAAITVQIKSGGSESSSLDVWHLYSLIHLPFSLLCSVSFFFMQRLQELHLQENSIELLAEQALSGLSSLALLDLSRNHLRTLGASSLKPLVSLQVLRVTGGRREGRILQSTSFPCVI